MLYVTPYCTSVQYVTVNIPLMHGYATYWGLKPSSLHVTLCDISCAWQLQPSAFRQVPVGSRGTQSNSQIVSGHVVHSPTHRRCWCTWYTVQLPDGIGSRGTQSNSQMVSGHVVHSPIHRRCPATWYIVQSKMVPRVQRYSSHSAALDKLRNVTKLHCSSSSWQSFLTTTKLQINLYEEGCSQPSVVTISCNSCPSSSFIRHDVLLVR
jgi:hypothetical protein